MLTRISVVVDRDVHGLAVLLAKEREVPYQHVLLNSIEKYYGVPESEYTGVRRYWSAYDTEKKGESDEAVVHRKKQRLTPRILRNRREQLRRKYLSRNKGEVMALQVRIQGLEEAKEHALQERREALQMNFALNTDIEKKERIIKSQAKDIEYLTSERKVWEAEINNIRCQKFHLQGSVEALTMIINKMLERHDGTRDQVKR